MSDRRGDPAILHVHGQRYPHDTLEIFGTTAGLERLVNALIDAVNVGRARCQFMVSDGCEAEGHIVCLDGQRRAEEWRRSGSPYLDVDDPLVARIIELTEDNARLRQLINQIRASRTTSVNSEKRGSAD